MSIVFADGPGNQGRVISKTQKMVLDAALLNTQYTVNSLVQVWTHDTATIFYNECLHLINCLFILL